MLKRLASDDGPDKANLDMIAQGKGYDWPHEIMRICQAKQLNWSPTTTTAANHLPCLHCRLHLPYHALSLLCTTTVINKALLTPSHSFSPVSHLRSAIPSPPLLFLHTALVSGCLETTVKIKNVTLTCVSVSRVCIYVVISLSLYLIRSWPWSIYPPISLI